MSTELTPEQTADLEQKKVIVKALLELPDVGKHDTRFAQEVALVAASSSKEQVVAIVEGLFGQPLKPAGENIPDNLSSSPLVRAMGGIRGDQTLYSHVISEHVTAYIAFWPWNGGARFSIKVGVYTQGS